MTPEERRAIEHACTRLIAHYANRNDAADWDAVAALYVEDGRMTRPSAPDQWIVGREAILAAFRARPARSTRHVCANIVIDVISETEATGESAMILFQPDCSPKAGSFHDHFVRTDDGWRFATRQGSLHF